MDYQVIKPLPGGANNRVFLVEYAGGRALLKSYFRHPDDPRDRLGAEWSFCEFAWGAGLRQAPKPLAKDAAKSEALYEFIEGKPCSAPGETQVLQAADFFRELNIHKSDAGRLKPASDSCFSLKEHLSLVTKRLKALDSAEDIAKPFIKKELLPAWERVAGGLRKTESPIPEEERCVSPSDFGFHNALVQNDGKIRFLDFEYSGWDDPAKMACDFFSQVAVPVPEGLMGAFLDRALKGFPSEKACRDRIKLLLPVHRFKWICLMLNDFLPAVQERRKFAGAGGRKASQLERAKRALSSLASGGSWPI